MKMTLFPGGLTLADKEGGFRFHAHEAVLMTRGWLEWVDPDRGEMTLRWEQFRGGVYHCLRVKTGGFTLEVPRARIIQSPDRVEILPQAPM